MNPSSNKKRTASAASFVEGGPSKRVKSDKTEETIAISKNEVNAESQLQIGEEETEGTEVAEQDNNEGDNIQITPPPRVRGPFKQKPVDECFLPKVPAPVDPVAPQEALPHWGVKPTSEDPKPHPDQPAAYEGKADTNPPLFEDRKFRFKRGSRFVKWFGPIKPDDADSLPDLDQEDLILLPLIDMRPISKKIPTPRRRPVYYRYEHGVPKDWTDKQAVKALNDRRCQNIDSKTQDKPFTLYEREYIAELIEEDPEVSIWDLTARFNDRFMGKEFAEKTAFPRFENLHKGRTVESICHEYRTWRAVYEDGGVPGATRAKVDKSFEGKKSKAHQNIEKVFRGETVEDNDEDSNDEDGGANGKSKKGASKRARKKVIPHKEPKAPKVSKKRSASMMEENDDEALREAASRMRKQPRLSDAEEDLLALAGVDNPREIRRPSSRRQFSYTSQHISANVEVTGSPLSHTPESILTPIPRSPLSQGQIDDTVSGEVANQVVVQECKTETTLLTSANVQDDSDVSSLDSPPVSPRTRIPPRAIRPTEIDENYDETTEDEEL